jgi:hypothetical protein
MEGIIGVYVFRLGGVLRKGSQSLGSIPVMMVVMILVAFAALVNSHLLMVGRSRGARRVSGVSMVVVVLVGLDDHDNNPTITLLTIFATATATVDVVLTVILSILARLQPRRRRLVVLANTLDSRLFSNTLIITTGTLVMMRR